MKNPNSWSNLHQPMLEDQIYHVFNQGNNGGNIFKTNENRIYFLSKLDKYLGQFVDIIGTCLMDNHYHLLFRVKSYNEIVKQIPMVKGLDKVIKRHRIIGKRNVVSIIISEMLRRCFMSYAKAFNKVFNRSGSLFRKNFRRKLITSEKYLRNVWIYIHKNPQIHRKIKNYVKYKWSSYTFYLKNEIKNDFVNLIFDKIFGDIKNYVDAHQYYDYKNEDKFYIIE
ncbi:MAG: hypothetical protein LBP67_04510 [Bacteroidales bacterium]|jgi:REP element-mobilizing transposase RayT|nr:hypothetical protein [Bacteroidales bacterium]